MVVVESRDLFAGLSISMISSSTWGALSIDGKGGGGALVFFGDGRAALAGRVGEDF